MSRAIRSGPASALWPSVAMIAGGALNIALWPIYTSVHGPGSVDMGGEVLGMGTLFWGSMMEGPSGLLIALGLAGSYGRLTGRAGRMARVGYVLTMIGVVIPALVNLAILAVVPPLLAPVFGTGLILMAVAKPTNFLVDAIQPAPAVGARGRAVLVSPLAGGGTAGRAGSDPRLQDLRRRCERTLRPGLDSVRRQHRCSGSENRGGSAHPGRLSQQLTCSCAVRASYPATPFGEHSRTLAQSAVPGPRTAVRKLLLAA
ncbi:MAG: hypothetical protein M3488_07660 [Actinomycetota bacterium]|nr:hypothetical protein [Actinomycetota bacterium]